MDSLYFYGKQKIIRAHMQTCDVWMGKHMIGNKKEKEKKNNIVALIFGATLT